MSFASRAVRFRTPLSPGAGVGGTGLAIGGTAIGALGIASAFLLYQYLRPKNKRQEQEQTVVIVEETESVVIEPQEDGLAHICVNPSELEEIKQLLITHNKAFLIKRF
jgi:hypothetical protein